ncbi:MAG: hypothetical protein U0931_11680 [Vulcanimicrobiota bacterium]
MELHIETTVMKKYLLLLAVAVFILGAMYHLSEQRKRERALQEQARIRSEQIRTMLSQSSQQQAERQRELEQTVKRTVLVRPPRQ